MKDKMLEMMSMQVTMNEKVDPNWHTYNWDFLRAARKELEELIDMIGWKWWKAHPEQNDDQIALELVDVWHFVMSEIIRFQMNASVSENEDLRKSVPTLDSIAQQYAEIWEGIVTGTLVDVDETFQTKDATPDQAHEIIILYTEYMINLLMNMHNPPKEDGYWNMISALFLMMYKFDIGPNELHTMYVAKNVLNIFRQDNGYKEGTYQKEWNGVEDNVVLASVIADLGVTNISYENIYEELDAKYSKLAA